ncbi:MAG TPA: arginine--tRNA ligase [Pseudonocardiaceae bacterium]|jgi:arginyl-tRNA synthetase|nr:arginine--tRNA ligase [Pseudonocardiaceae bacterium]
MAKEDGRLADHEVRSLHHQVAAAVSGAIDRALPEQAGADPVIRSSERADFQANAALALARQAHCRPAELAATVVDALPTDDLVAEVSVSGPGFVNLVLADGAIWRQVAARLTGPRHGIGTPQSGLRTVVEYSGVNIAKEMHVGHLRTTILGDCLARVLDFLGAEVIRQNHLGDWGTQFGMLIQYLDEHPDVPWRRDQLAEGASAVSVLDDLYRAARREFDADPEFADRARSRVVVLQAGDEATLARWREIVAESELSFSDNYQRLGVLLRPEDSAGESFYNPWLAEVNAELAAEGIAVDSDGALVVPSTTETGPDGKPVVLMLRKSDGGYGYDTTDLAAIRYRVRDLRANRILYVVDSRQALHFRLVFDTARRAGWLPDGVEAVHVAYGAVLGPDGKPFKTRAGDTVRLLDLLATAVTKARATVTEKSPDLPDAELDRIAEQAGIAAVKYADLSTSRIKDYVFDVDRMVSSTGNTGVYLQYAHVRLRSILRKAGASAAKIDPSLPPHPAERALALALDAFGDILAEVGEVLEPHRLCGYLYELAKTFNEFYLACPVLSVGQPLRANRIALCQLAADTLGRGLDLLGIAAPERM